jgi:hypothetical protein
MAKGKQGPKLQQYPRLTEHLLAKPDLFPRLIPPMPLDTIINCVDKAFERCSLKKSGKKREIHDSPEELVE